MGTGEEGEEGEEGEKGDEGEEKEDGEAGKGKSGCEGCEDTITVQVGSEIRTYYISGRDLGRTCGDGIGDFFAFDDSFLHSIDCTSGSSGSCDSSGSSGNSGNSSPSLATTVVLIIDIWHPELTKSMVSRLRELRSSGIRSGIRRLGDPGFIRFSRSNVGSEGTGSEGGDGPAPAASPYTDEGRRALRSRMRQDYDQDQVGGEGGESGRSGGGREGAEEGMAGNGQGRFLDGPLIGANTWLRMPAHASGHMMTFLPALCVLSVSSVCSAWRRLGRKESVRLGMCCICVYMCPRLETV